ncbi:Immune-associated nucleotide-binding protein 9 [Linum grandiflorum]
MSSNVQEVLERCENRTVLFDNQTKDEVKRIQQVNQLMKLVQNVVVQNGGLPYTNELFIEMQKQAAQLKLDSLTSKSAANQELIDLKEEIKKSEEQLELITEMLTAELKEQLKAEEAARWKAEVAREIEELRKQVAAKGSCSIV